MVEEGLVAAVIFILLKFNKRVVDVHKIYIKDGYNRNFVAKVLAFLKYIYFVHAHSWKPSHKLDPTLNLEICMKIWVML